MDRPKSLFEFHSNSAAVPAGNNLLTDCALCGKEKHFFFHPETEMWDCKVCGERGNPIEFLRKFYASLDTATRAATELAAIRQLPFSAMSAAGVKFNPLNGSYLIPTFKNGSLSNLYKAVRNSEGKFVVMCSPRIEHSLMNWEEDPKDTIWIFEGHWDRIAANAILSNQDITPIGVPGASVWKPHWCDVFAGRDIVFFYDKDEAGRTGRDRVITKYIANHPSKPKSISYVKWPEEKKAGYDVSDHYAEWGRGSYNKLRDLIVEYEAPEDLVVTKTTVDHIAADTSIVNFEQLIDRYKEKYYTTPCMEMAMLLVLSSIYSIKVEGEQIWIRLIGAPSSGKTSIAKAMSGSTQVVLKSTFTGLFSGWKDKEGDSDASLVPLIAGKTLIVKDADALLKQKNIEQIFSELRDFYDKDSSTFYKNKVANDYHNIRSTMILMGTYVIRRSDQSFLGERFLDFELELSEQDRVKIEEIMLAKSITMAGDPSGTPADSSIIAAGKGFIEHLMARDPMTQLDARSQNNILTWARLASTMRTKVDREKFGSKDISSRPIVEVSARLIGQIAKLYMCASTVLNLKKPDERVHNLVCKVTRDIMDMTSYRMRIVKWMCGEEYRSRDELVELAKMPFERCTLELADLVALDLIEGIKVQTNTVGRATTKWRLKRVYANDLQHIIYE
jgi:hypothetical protein